MSGQSPDPIDQEASVVTAADELFVNLDGSVVRSSGRQWRVEVCGIHSYGSQNWVQLNLCGHDNYGLTLCADRLEASRILGLLRAWLPGATHDHLQTSAVSAARA